VYFLPATVEVFPAFLQLAPALIAADAFNGATRANTRVSASKLFFMGKVSRVAGSIATTRPYKYLIQIKNPPHYATGPLIFCDYLSATTLTETFATTL
jgi:hypothetical protein